MAPLGLAFEIIFVDDGSKDATFARCAALAAADPRVKVIKFRRNCGQTAAMVAGIEHARGATLVTMDADLQNDPADIPRLLAKIREGYDLVVGWRYQRQDRLLSRRLPSVIANRLIAKVTGVDIKDNGCSLKAYRADLIKRVPLYAEMHRFIPAMSSLAGARIAQIKVNHRARRHGQSKYGLSRVYKVLVDLIVIKTLLLFAARPLFCFIGSAAVAGALALLCAAGGSLSGDDDRSILDRGVHERCDPVGRAVAFSGPDRPDRFPGLSDGVGRLEPAALRGAG